jgi:hypothetical protein
MTLPGRDKLILLLVFYKSTLLLSIVASSVMAILKIFSVADMLLAFGLCFLSAGTVITLLHKEGYKQQEYYFYYNKGIPKWWLVATCITGNLITGIILIALSQYAK